MFVPKMTASVLLSIFLSVHLPLQNFANLLEQIAIAKFTINDQPTAIEQRDSIGKVEDTLRQAKGDAFDVGLKARLLKVGRQRVFVLHPESQFLM